MASVRDQSSAGESVTSNNRNPPSQNNGSTRRTSEAGGRRGPRNPPRMNLQHPMMRNRPEGNINPRMDLAMPVARDSILYRMLRNSNNAPSQSDQSSSNEPPLILVPCARNAPQFPLNSNQSGSLNQPAYVDIAPASVQFWDLMLLPGPGSETDNQNDNPQFIGPVVSYTGPDHGGPNALNPLQQPMGAQQNEEHGAASDERDQVVPASHGTACSATDQTFPLQDGLPKMTVDAVNLTSEELLSLKVEEETESLWPGLSEETILELLKRTNFESCTNINETSEDAKTCYTCKEEYVCDDEIGTLNCGHEFHTACIKQWLVLKNKCPICKTKALDA